jgi:hypothetical protein
MKEDLNGHPYDLNEEVEKTVRTCRKKQNVELLNDGSEKLVYLWSKCVENGGDYVEEKIQVMKGLISRTVFCVSFIKRSLFR